MVDPGYAGLIEDCREERAALIGLIEAVESKMLVAGTPITIPVALTEHTVAAVASMTRSVADLTVLITAYETESNS
jgi:hypothetical protein